MLHHLLKVVLGKLVGDPEQLATGVSVGERPDTQTVAGVQLTLQELATNVLENGILQTYHKITFCSTVQYPACTT